MLSLRKKLSLFSRSLKSGASRGKVRYIGTTLFVARSKKRPSSSLSFGTFGLHRALFFLPSRLLLLPAASGWGEMTSSLLSIFPSSYSSHSCFFSRKWKDEQHPIRSERRRIFPRTLGLLTFISYVPRIHKKEKVQCPDGT